MKTVHCQSGHHGFMKMWGLSVSPKVCKVVFSIGGKLARSFRCLCGQHGQHTEMEAACCYSRLKSLPCGKCGRGTCATEKAQECIIYKSEFWGTMITSALDVQPYPDNPIQCTASACQFQEGSTKIQCKTSQCACPQGACPGVCTNCWTPVAIDVRHCYVYFCFNWPAKLLRTTVVSSNVA